MLSVGGWNEGSVKYSHMASSVEFRKAFIDSALEFLDMYGFKGLDLDWEYPTQRGGRPEDKDNFILLLKELKEAFQPYGYLLSAAVSAGKTNIDAAYDIPSISNYLDLINLMSYDYHGDWEPYTGLNAPLYARPDETEGNKTLNVNFSVNYWIASGAPANKINLGLGTYGRTFSLADPRVHGFYAPVYGPGEGGPYTEEAGDLGYNEICEAQSLHPEWPVVVDEFYQAPYTYSGNQWIGYDDMDSIRKKCELANSLNLGGVMVWAVDTDDFRGVCGNGVYPLMKVINEIMGR
ncbi:Chitinase 2, variant 2 [Chamberlinius hualienensis]